MECKPDSVGLNPDDDLSTFQGNITNTNSTSEGNSTGNTPEVTSKSESAASLSVSAPSPGCLWNVPVLYEEADVLSLRYSPVKGPNVNVTDTHPTLLSYPLPTQATGGTLNLQLTINAVSMSVSVRKSQVRKLSVLLKQYLIDMCVCVCCLQTNVTLGTSHSVVACFSQGAPVLHLNQSCFTGITENTSGDLNRCNLGYNELVW